MPQFPLFQRQWGNVAVFDAIQSEKSVRVTVQCEDVSATGEMVSVFQAISDADSVDDFRTICSERGFLM